VPWDVPEFRTGVAVGAVAAVALSACSFVAPRRPGTLIPLAGAALSIGALVGFDRVGSLPGRVVVGVLGTAVVVVTWAARRWPAWSAVIGLAPFAYVVAEHPDLARPHWLAPLLVVAITLGAASAMAFETAEGTTGTTAVLLAISAAGVYWAVPDTELPACLLGVAVPVALVAWPWRRATAGRAGAVASVVPLYWAAAIGGLGRPASVVGTTACLGLLVGVPVARTLSRVVLPARETAVRLGAWRAPALLAAHAALVAVASRTAGTRERVRSAALLAIVVVLASVVVGVVFATAAPRPRVARDR
jgi:hypothetical protein